MPDFTPGPWTITKEYACHENIGIAEGKQVAQTYCDQAHTGLRGEVEERKANARLIAAAPDLLEALKAARGWWLSLGIQDADDDLIAAVGLMDAALAKAEGKS